MTFSLSINAILTQVLAETALRHLLHHDRPALLTADHREALATLARATFGMICLALIPAITDCSLGKDTDTAADISPDHDLLQADINTPAHVNPVALRLLLEHAIASHILAEAYAGSDTHLSATFAREYDTALQRARTTLTLGTPRASIIPAWL